MTWYPRVAALVGPIKFYNCPKAEMLEWLKQYWRSPFLWAHPKDTLEDHQREGTENIFIPWDNACEYGAECLEPGMVVFYKDGRLTVMKEKEFFERYEEIEDLRPEHQANEGEESR